MASPADSKRWFRWRYRPFSVRQRKPRRSPRSWERALALGSVLIVGGGAVAFWHNAETDNLTRNLTEVTGVVLVAVGGSLLATALVARLVANQVFGINVGAAIEALRGASQLARKNQCLTITLEVEEGLVVATGKHEFDLMSSSRLAMPRPLSLYTDVGVGGGGFFSIKEPGGELNKEELDKYFVTAREGKVQFEKDYFVQNGGSSRFVVQTFGRFRTSDRLIWTVEHISSDFTVRILDRRRSATPPSIKINHHRREAIAKNMQEHRDARGVIELEIDFLGEVLPYQGFELQWQP